MEVTRSGAVGLQVVRVHKLTVGSQRFRDLEAALLPARTSDAERVEDGLLPMVLFQAVYINNREGFVILNPRAKKN